MTITIDGYLTQGKLEKVLSESHDIDLIGTEVNVPGTRCRWDFVCCVQGIPYVVEFDGDQHFLNPDVILSDRKKDRIALDCGYRVVRIPYFVQLTTETFEHFFKCPQEINQDFKHGFIDKKAKLPAHYCELGIKRFENEIFTYPQSVRMDIIDSLRVWMGKKEKEAVVPSLRLNVLILG